MMVRVFGVGHFCMIMVFMLSFVFLGSAFAQGSEECFECSECNVFEQWNIMCAFMGLVCTIQGLPQVFCDEQKQRCEKNIYDLIAECRKICRDNCDGAETCPDGACDAAGGECSTCAADCTIADCCGADPLCNAGVGENNANCPGDCPAGCIPDGCNGVCPAGCAPAGDPDCPAGGCCGDGTCNAGEDCTTCADCACTAPQICCGGTCQNLICNNDGDCDDSDECTTDICNNAGTCAVSCSNTAIVACLDNDNCCPAGCDSITDNDCIVLPPSFDWSHKVLPSALPVGGDDWMSPVRNQGRCGSCWAHSAVGTVEAMYNIEQNNPNLNVDLSEQYLVSDCYPRGDCGGGKEGSALGYTRDSGISDEACYPYRASDSSCGRCADWSTRLWTIDRISSYGMFSTTDDQLKRALVTYGPLSTRTSIFGALHGIVVVGYSDPGRYWIFKNSWGAGWGSGGYGKIPYADGLGNRYGIHGVNSP